MWMRPSHPAPHAGASTPSTTPPPRNYIQPPKCTPNKDKSKGQGDDQRGTTHGQCRRWVSQGNKGGGQPGPPSTGSLGPSQTPSLVWHSVMCSIGESLNCAGGGGGANHNTLSQTRRFVDEWRPPSPHKERGTRTQKRRRLLLQMGGCIRRPISRSVVSVTVVTIVTKLLLSRLGRSYLERSAHNRRYGWGLKRIQRERVVVVVNIAARVIVGGWVMGKRIGPSLLLPDHVTMTLSHGTQILWVIQPECMEIHSANHL